MATGFNLNIIKSRFSKSILYVLPFIEGGTTKHTHEMLERLAKEYVSVILLCYDSNGYVRLQHNIIEQAKDIFYSPSAMETMVSDLKELGILHVHFQHTINAPKTIQRIASRLGCKYDVTLHDYYYLCPTITYTDMDERYIGDSKPEKIDEFIKQGRPMGLYAGNFVRDYGTVAKFRKYNEEFLNAARKVFVPSQNTLDRYKKHYKDVKYSLKPHFFNPKIKDLSNKNRDKKDFINVGILGGISKVKGSNFLNECAKAVSYDDMPIRFKVIGHTDMDYRIAHYYNVDVTGKYEEKELEGLIKNANLDMFFLPSQWPETHSYTLSYAFTYGLYPIVFDLGAPAERVKSARYGDVISFDSTPKEVCQHFINCVDKAAKAKPMLSAVKYNKLIESYYEF